MVVLGADEFQLNAPGSRLARMFAAAHVVLNNDDSIAEAHRILKYTNGPEQILNGADQADCAIFKPRGFYANNDDLEGVMYF